MFAKLYGFEREGGVAGNRKVALEFQRGVVRPQVSSGFLEIPAEGKRSGPCVQQAIFGKRSAGSQRNRACNGGELSRPQIQGSREGQIASSSMDASGSPPFGG